MLASPCHRHSSGFALLSALLVFVSRLLLPVCADEDDAEKIARVLERLKEYDAEEVSHWHGVETPTSCRRPWQFFDRTPLVWQDWFRRECSRSHNKVPVYYENATSSMRVFAFDRFVKRSYLRDGAGMENLCQDPALYEKQFTWPFRMEYVLPRRGLEQTMSSDMLDAGRTLETLQPEYGKDLVQRETAALKSACAASHERATTLTHPSVSQTKASQRHRPRISPPNYFPPQSKTYLPLRSSIAQQKHPVVNMDLDNYRCRPWNHRPEDHIDVSVEADIYAVINPIRSKVTKTIEVSMATGLPRELPIYRVVARTDGNEDDENGQILAGRSTSAAIQLDSLGASDKTKNVNYDYDMQAGRFRSFFVLHDRSASSGNYTIYLPHDTYEHRFNGSSIQLKLNSTMGCDTPLGLWSHDTRPVVRCVLDSLAEFLHMDETTSVLDWGSGCGHQLAYLAGSYGVSGLGIEPVLGAATSAQKHYEGRWVKGKAATAVSAEGVNDPSDRTVWAEQQFFKQPLLSTATNPPAETAATVRFCQDNGADLSHLPSNSFTHVLSYGALYHFEPTAQCDILHQMVRVAREKVVIGWHVASPTTYASATCPGWERCLEMLRLKTRGLYYGVVEVCMPERCIFGQSTYDLPFDSIIIQKVYGSVAAAGGVGRQRA
ncbi:unnamed protein product [Amoebophrya sp. A120]|nr:unnamed protein product [Amoebophrya sp. A120]|eukprot:GSA120T00018936001.1